MAVKWVKTIRQILVTQPKSEDRSLGSSTKNVALPVSYACTQYSTVLPRMPNSLHRNARKSWHGALIDQDMERLLELKLNEYKLQNLYPLKTAGDGNRLLEAVCLAIWGFHDISAVLKDDLRTATNDDNFRTRWQNKLQKTNRGHTQAEWDDEWQKMLQRTESSGLWEDIHVFVLAQLLYRPIVVLSEDEQLAGIYMPLDQHPDNCVKTPIVLAYAGHFVPLVSTDPAIDETNLSGVPLVSPGSAQPVIQFLRPEEEPASFELLQRYMVVTSVPTVDGGWIPAAKLNPIKLDPELDLIDKYCKSYDKEDKENTPGDSYTCEVEMCNSEPRRQPSAVLCDATNETEEDDSCSYPHCEQPAPEPWWPFCYEHSPDSGLAPGGLLHDHNKWVEETGGNDGNINEMEVQLEDEMPTCVGPECSSSSDAACNGLCRNCHNILCSSRTPSRASSSSTDETIVEEEDEEDICSYPRCEQTAPEPWWPFCYRHSPDSGWAPGGLLYEFDKWEDNKCKETEQAGYDHAHTLDYRQENISMTSAGCSSLTPLRSPRCLEPGCPLFGDPNFDGYCTRCYRPRLP